MDLQPIFDLAQVCYLKGIQQAVISPGSRNAALTLAFVRHPHMDCYSVPDERSAAFMALGMSLKSGVATVLICTSGSAALNYAPAIAEAFFNQVPLLILSADRPPEWIGQRDGQTIYQENMYGRHVKASYTYPSLEEDQHAATQAHQLINEAIHVCHTPTPGPVHINVPFREPFYPTADSSYTYPEKIDIADFQMVKQESFTASLHELESYDRILIVVGQKAKDAQLRKYLNYLSTLHGIPVVADIISNAHEVDGVISSQDVFLKENTDDQLRPTLLITMGLSVISKNLKLYLRNQKPEAHWHLDPEEQTADTYQALSRHVRVVATDFLAAWLKDIKTNPRQMEFYKRWQRIHQTTSAHVQAFRSASFSDLKGYQIILSSLPNQTDLHLANSMAVRYANIIGLPVNTDIEVFCNRGTSGIDGSNSTAVGSALMTSRQTVLMTGDMAFLYDRNAFWHNHLPDHLRIIIFNNHGGGIFRMIEGPSQQLELEAYFETRQQKDARWLAKDYDFEYLPCHNETELVHSLTTFFQPGQRKIMEIFTDAEESKKAFKELFHKLPK